MKYLEERLETLAKLEVDLGTRTQQLQKALQESQVNLIKVQAAQAELTALKGELDAINESGQTPERGGPKASESGDK